MIMQWSIIISSLIKGPFSIQQLIWWLDNRRLKGRDQNRNKNLIYRRLHQIHLLNSCSTIFTPYSPLHHLSFTYILIILILALLHYCTLPWSTLYVHTSLKFIMPPLQGGGDLDLPLSIHPSVHLKILWHRWNLPYGYISSFILNSLYYTSKLSYSLLFNLRIFSTLDHSSVVIIMIAHCCQQLL